MPTGDSAFDRGMKIKTRQVVAGVGLALLAGGAPVLAQGIRTLDAGGGHYVTQVGPRAAVREPSGLVTELSLPPGASLRRLVALADGWVAAGEVDAGGFSDLFLLRSSEGIRAPFAVPPNAEDHELRGGPMPLVERGRLVGLAWLGGAGVRQTAVYASMWSGLDWSKPELVSPIGPGTQIAIDGAVLADGSWLLVWSAYDGGDDEIVWSRRVGGSWSEPAPLHQPNDVPDITPAIVATGRGALAAWNAFDGSLYRVRLAAFEDGGWRDLGLADTGGAVSPSLTRHGGGALLLYRTVVPPTWTLHQLDERGLFLRHAVAESESTLQPGVAPLGLVAPEFEWPESQG